MLKLLKKISLKSLWASIKKVMKDGCSSLHLYLAQPAPITCLSQVRIPSRLGWRSRLRSKCLILPLRYRVAR